MKKISIVIPALNEEKSIVQVINEIPYEAIRKLSYDVEVIVIDNGSTDNTALYARKLKAKIIFESKKGYGHAYKTGINAATGDIICTGDADLTYPFSILPKIIKIIEKEGIDFVNTDRLTILKSGVMSKSHLFGNRFLSFIMKIFFGWPFKDSQSGMWIFKKKIWKELEIISSGMAFSQEIKLEAFIKGFKCREIPIDYRSRIGKEKLNIVKDGIGNLQYLIKKRFN